MSERSRGAGVGWFGPINERELSYEPRYPFRELHASGWPRGSGVDVVSDRLHRRGGWLHDVLVDGSLVPDGAVRRGARSDAGGLRVARFSRRPDGAHYPGAAGHGRHVPSSRVVGEDRHHARRLVRGARATWHWGGLVRARASGSRSAVPVTRRAVRAAPGDAPDLLSDGERCRGAFRGPPLPARRDDLLAPADSEAEAKNPRGRERREKDASTGRSVR